MADVTGTLVAIEYRTDKYNQETRTTEPCTPHYVFKFRLPEDAEGRVKHAYVRQYDTPKTKQFLSKFAQETGLGEGMKLMNTTKSLYEKQDNPNYPPAWNISTRQAPPAPPSRQPVPQPAQQQAPTGSRYSAPQEPDWTQEQVPF